MLNDFTWNMTGYIPKHHVNPHGDGIIPYVAERIFQLEPEPPAVGNLNEYILSALQEKNLLYFSFFLHHYEPQLMPTVKIWSVTSRSQIRRKMRICVEPMPFPDAAALLMSLL